MMSCFSTLRIQEEFSKIHLSSHAKIQVAGGNELARFPTFATTYWQEWQSVIEERGVNCLQLPRQLRRFKFRTNWKLASMVQKRRTPRML